MRRQRIHDKDTETPAAALTSNAARTSAATATAAAAAATYIVTAVTCARGTQHLNTAAGSAAATTRAMARKTAIESIVSRPVIPDNLARRIATTRT